MRVKGLNKKTILVMLLSILVGWVYFIHTDVAHSTPPATTPQTASSAVQAGSSAVDSDLGLKGKLGELIAQTPKSTDEYKKGCIDPNAHRGYLGIPGGPTPSFLMGFLWAIWVGWIFSTVGAFGGIMAGVGHITIFGLSNYAKSFKETNSVLNKFITDSIRVSNQFLVGLSALVSTVNYAKMKRLVAPLGIAMAVGSVGGSILIPVLTVGKISLKAYLGYFGLAVFAVAAFLFYSTTGAGMAKRRAAKEAAKRFQKAVKKGGSGATEEGVRIQKFSLTECVFSFYNVEFRFNPILAAVGGFLIASMASFLGIGGGFLLVPFMTDVVKLPMFIVAGTSALTVLIGMGVSIFSYMVLKGVMVWWPLIGVELAGIFIGSMIGPRTQKYIPEVWLKRLFVILAIYVGLRYSSKGFLGHSIVPPY